MSTIEENKWCIFDDHITVPVPVSVNFPNTMMSHWICTEISTRLSTGIEKSPVKEVHS